MTTQKSAKQTDELRLSAAVTVNHDGIAAVSQELRAERRNITYAGAGSRFEVMGGRHEVDGTPVILLRIDIPGEDRTTVLAFLDAYSLQSAISTLQDAEVQTFALVYEASGSIIKHQKMVAQDAEALPETPE